MTDYAANHNARTLSNAGTARKAQILPNLLSELERERRARGRRRLAFRSGLVCVIVAAGVWLASGLTAPVAPDGPTIADKPPARGPAAAASRVERLTPARLVTRLDPAPGSFVTPISETSTRATRARDATISTRLSDAELRAASIAAGRDLGVVRTADAVYVVSAGDG